MVRARRKHEERLEDRRHRLGEDRLAQPLGEIRAARLARDDDVRRLGADRIGNEFDVRRLAGAVDALEGDELHLPAGRRPPSW